MSALFSRMSAFTNNSCYFQSSCDNDDPYRGCHWSQRTAARTMFEIKEGPGPAEYDARKVSTCRRNEVEEEYREMAQRFSYLPRYTEQQIILAKRQVKNVEIQYLYFSISFFHVSI